MVKEEFKRQIAQAVPRPDVKTTEAWYSYGLDMCGEFSYDFLAAMMTSFSFLKHNFSPETVQAVYGVISYAAILPSELVAAAVYMQHGETAPRVTALADQGSLITRLKAKKCEWCGAEDVDLEIHHVRKLKNLKGKAAWERAMIGRKRKTMALCVSCHDLLHAGKLD